MVTWSLALIVSWYPAINRAVIYSIAERQSDGNLAVKREYLQELDSLLGVTCGRFCRSQAGYLGWWNGHRSIPLTFCRNCPYSLH